ncbi:MAG: response regulator, partial [Cyanobacteria bacterium]|nr:response regulator [Cyanobacteriota bacterium]
MKVLVVDDSAVMRKILIRELTSLNYQPYEICEATDGAESVQLALNNKFEAILMDWNMPAMLGIDAV